MKRAVRVVLAIVVIQAALVGVYWLVEGRRSSERSAAVVLGTAPPERVKGPMPWLTVQRRDGSRVELSSFERPTLVHIWATWCPPCRAELPGVLELPAEYGIDVVAIALDESWADVERFLGGADGSNVFLADGESVKRALGVGGLPVSLLVGAEGRIALRFDGARDWTDKAFVMRYMKEHADGR